MTFYDLKDLFKEYAAALKDIKHTESTKGFVACHEDDSPEAFVKACTTEFIMVLLTYDQKMMPVKGENYNWDKNICFFILQRAARKGEDEIIAAQTEAEIIGNEIFAKLLEDRYSRIRSFQPESWVMLPAGPMFGDMYGRACMFNLVDEAQSVTNPARWL